MILVEWKGDDERPYRLSFHPRLTLVHVPSESRNRLVGEIAAAFESQLSKLADPAEDGRPLNVLDHEDLEWLMPPVDPSPAPLFLEGLFDENGKPESFDPHNAMEALNSSAYDDDQAPNFAALEDDESVYVMGAQPTAGVEVHSRRSEERAVDFEAMLADLEHRRLKAQDDFAAAEANYARAVDEASAAAASVEDPSVSAARNQVERLRKILQWRVDNLQQSLGRYQPDLTEVRSILAAASSDELGHLVEVWDARAKEIEEFIANGSGATKLTRPPEWLIEQSQRELALAEQALEVFAVHHGEHEPSFLEREAQRRHSEALEVWTELQPYITGASDGAESNTSIQELLEELEVFSGRKPENAEHALEIIRECIHDMHRSMSGQVELRAALEREGRYLPSTADVFAEARLWLQNREADLAERRKHEAQISELQADIDRLDATLATWVSEVRTPPATAWALQEAEVAFDAARTHHETELAAIDAEYAELSQLREAAPNVTDLRSETATASDTPEGRLGSAVNALRETLEEPVPLIINAAFDDLAPADRNRLLQALISMSGDQQIIYFTQSDSVVAWAEAQDEQFASLCTVTV